ncbi:hypothetical protein Y032_0636g937 [Ancylostoma ceylanicum]|uniref:Uncharacterized protein n=1 Tax=Ancylostoma ceylanicum TaxID=53326 RepID=A0A016WLM0_9BILA|nr:hypothetical protein Y032_0636g937 [Ancylostoma ceylanicum]
MSGVPVDLTAFRCHGVHAGILVLELFCGIITLIIAKSDAKSCVGAACSDSRDIPFASEFSTRFVPRASSWPTPGVCI